MATLRGTLAAFDSTGYLATVRLDGGTNNAMPGIRTSRAIPAAEMVVGRTVIVHQASGAARDFAVVAVLS